MSKEITFNGKRYRLSQGVVVYWAPRNGWVRETDSEIVEKVKALAKPEPPEPGSENRCLFTT